MKRKWSRLISGINMKRESRLYVGVLMGVMLLLVLGCRVQAATAHPFEDKQAHIPKAIQRVIVSSAAGKGCDYISPVYSKNFTIKAKSSNPKVAVTKIYDWSVQGQYMKGVLVNQKGYGSTNITVTVKVNGKTYKKTFKYQYYKYENPFTSFKINNKNYVSRFNKLQKSNNGDKYVKWQLSEGKLTYTLKKNYKVKQIAAYSKTGEVRLKNNSQIPGSCEFAWIYYQNTKTKAEGCIRISQKIV